MGAFTGRSALVTGGASGIGKATAERLAAEGAAVIVADRNAEAGEKVAADIGGSFAMLDVADPSSWATLVEGPLANATEAGVPLGIVHLNAGVTTGQGDLTLLTDDEYRRIMGANVDGVVYGIRAVAPVLEANGGGAIVATASLAGLLSFPPDPIYTGTKHFVVGLVRSSAMGLSARGVTINAVCPGIVDTPLVPDGAREMLQSGGIVMIEPSEIAAAVVHAATNGSTGECFECRAGKDPVVHVFPAITLV